MTRTAVAGGTGVHGMGATAIRATATGMDRGFRVCTTRAGINPLSIFSTAVGLAISSVRASFRAQS